MCGLVEELLVRLDPPDLCIVVGLGVLVEGILQSAAGHTRYATHKHTHTQVVMKKITSPC